MACAASEPKMANCVSNSGDWYILTRFGNTESQLNGCSLFTDTCKFSKNVTVWSSWSVFPLNFYTLGGSPGQRNLVLLSDLIQNCILELRCLFFWSSLLLSFCCCCCSTEIADDDLLQLLQSPYSTVTWFSLCVSWCRCSVYLLKAM